MSGSSSISRYLAEAEQHRDQYQAIRRRRTFEVVGFLETGTLTIVLLMAGCISNFFIWPGAYMKVYIQALQVMVGLCMAGLNSADYPLGVCMQ